MTTVGIIGLGLIGGSLGLDLRTQGIKVLGVSRRETTCRIALQRGAVDQASINLEILSEASIIFICTPIAAITSSLRALIPYLTPATIITDVGSVKSPIVDECTQLWPYFVGSHPMAGTAEQGIEAAQYNLFENAPYIITPTASTPKVAVEKVQTIARSLGCRLYTCLPQDHDQAVAWISHLPVIVSASLIKSCLGESNLDILTLAQQLASSGFRDTSRVGGGNPELGVMMAQYNREALLRSLLAYRQTLDQLVAYIQTENWQELETILNCTQTNRNQFLK
jgi:arogenate dehydrogenase (NADP+)